MIRMLILRLKLLITFFKSNANYNLGKLGKKNIFIFLGADYGNLGDVAITYALKEYLINHYDDYNIVEIPISHTFSAIKTVRKVVGNDDIIALIGGGNTSDLYDDIEWLRQLVVLSFRKNRIIGFPQTYDFTDSLKGKFCRYIAYFIYRKALKLTIIARERNTMKVLNTEFASIHAEMAPDIVMSLDERRNIIRNGVLLCMRSDKEKLIADDYKHQLVEKLKQKYGNITYQDTQVSDVDEYNRYSKLRELISKFQCHELVVTDRLHGMILCFITGTPALVFDNSNHKISACFEWIKDCGYIKLIQSLDEIDSFNPADNFKTVHNNIIFQFQNLSCLKFH